MGSAFHAPNVAYPRVVPTGVLPDLFNAFMAIVFTSLGDMDAMPVVKHLGKKNQAPGP